jgi:alpha/beta superfamily hydrolase
MRRAEPLEIAGPAGRIEALLELPEAAAAVPAFGVVCHPHPLFGGAMTNKVVHTVALAMRAAGLPTLRFNFRGVGSSAGIHDAGRGEVDDLAAVVAEGRRRWPGAALWLGGFSFGAYVALQATARLAPALLVTVAPPLGRWDFSQLVPPACPWLILQGDRDELVDAVAVGSWAAALPQPPQLVLLAGADHFFHGRLHELRAAIEAFAAATAADHSPGGAPEAAARST